MFIRELVFSIRGKPMDKTVIYMLVIIVGSLAIVLLTLVYLRKTKAGLLAKLDYEKRLNEAFGESKELNGSLNQLLETLRTTYSLIIQINISKNSYKMMEYDSYATQKMDREGRFDELIRVGASTIPDEEQSQEFFNLFNREAMLKAYEKGERRLSLRHQQTADDGSIHWILTIAMLSENNGDIVCISMGRIIDSEVENEMRSNGLKNAISGMAEEYCVLMHHDFDKNKTDILYYDSVYPFSPEDNSFELLINNYAQRAVCELDRTMFLNAVDKDYVLGKIKAKENIVVTYRSDYGEETRWMELKITHHAEHGNSNCVMLGFRNITENVTKDQKIRAELESAMLKAKAANEAKTSFLFNMSHDIRTPMNAIMGYTTMAKKYIGDRNLALEYLDKIELSSGQLLSLINQVLEMSRIESGKNALQLSYIDLLEKSKGILAVFDAQAQEKNISLTCNLDGIKHKNVLADESRLNQIVTNILGNAFKYTQEGGTVDFSIEEKVSARPQYGRYIFTIADTGIGMSEEFVKNIYEEFSREKNSTISGIQGTGLGMSIVKKLVDLFEGDINIESQKDKGTKVTIGLDFYICDENRNVSNKKISDLNNEIHLEGRRILLVEDNEMNREIAKDMLEDYGFIVHEAKDGIEAADKIANAMPGFFDAVLMDIQMPEMNGYEATARIRTLEKKDLASIPIIALSANAFEEDEKKSIEAGMDAHIGKPINIQKLIRVLNDLINK